MHSALKKYLKQWSPHTLAFLLFLLASVYITYPLIFHLGDMATGRGDELLISWIHSWDLHAFLTHPLEIFNANIYFPYSHTLAYSDTFFTSSILASVPLLVIGQPIGAVNFTLISSLTLLGFCSYLFVYYFSKNIWSSLIAGTLIIFSPAVLDKAVHLQILAIYWVLLSILCFIHFLNTHKFRYLVLAAAFFVLQMWNSFMPGYFIVLAGLILGICLFVWKREYFSPLWNKKTLLLVGGVLVVTIPMVVPYFQVSQEFHYTRDIRDTIHFALQPEDFGLAFGYTRLSPFLLSLQHPKTYPASVEFKTGYLGFLFSLLAILTVVYWLRNFKKESFFFHSFMFTSLLGLLLSLGPFLHLGRQTIHHPFPIPLPYLLFYYLAPGFKGFRNSARFEMLFILFIAACIGIFLHKLLQAKPTSVKVLVYAILFIGIIGEYAFPMPLTPIPQKQDFPAVYSWLSTTPLESKFIEMPIYDWNMFPYGNVELMREYYATVHFRKMINGYSGFSPQPWQDLVYSLDETFPSQNSLEMLRTLKLNYIIVHADEYDTLHQEKFTVSGKQIPASTDVLAVLKKQLKLTKQFGNTYVFSL